MVMCQTASLEAASTHKVDLDAANYPCSWLFTSCLMCSYETQWTGGGIMHVQMTVFYLCVLKETLRNELSTHVVNKQHQYAESIKVDLNE